MGMWNIIHPNKGILKTKQINFIYQKQEKNSKLMSSAAVDIMLSTRVAEND